MEIYAGVIDVGLKGFVVWCWLLYKFCSASCVVGGCVFAARSSLSPVFTKTDGKL